MKATYIDYADTHSFSDTLIRYINRDERLKPFYGQHPDLNGFAEKLMAQPPAPHRNLLVKVLLEQYRELLPFHPKVTQNISLLARDNTFTITTGHQLNIFTGPLYFIYKIASAVRLCQQLKQQHPDKNFVPVYWMATEDHDFAEINHTTIGGKVITWETACPAATGRLSTATIHEAVRAYCNILGLSEHSRRLSGLVEKAYLEHASLAAATRFLVNALFSEYGLVILDADHPALKKVFAPIMERDILEQNSYREIGRSTQSLQEAGFPPQVNVREINFFYLTDTYRERLVRQDSGHYTVLNQEVVFTEAELRQEIAAHPERFSPNVMMRPLYQEWLLPNLAYVGGGAEIAYWLQLKQNFDYYGVSFPILIPRNSAILADENTVNKTHRLDMTLRDLFLSADQLKKQYIRHHTRHQLTLSDEWVEFKSIFEKIKLRAHKIDPTLGPSTEAVRARMEKAIRSLEKKLIRADAKNHEEALLQIDRIRDRLFPGGILQERTENFGLHYVKHGDTFIPDLIRHFQPLDFRFTILY